MGPRPESHAPITLYPFGVVNEYHHKTPPPPPFIKIGVPGYTNRYAVIVLGLLVPVNRDNAVVGKIDPLQGDIEAEGEGVSGENFAWVLGAELKV